METSIFLAKLVGLYLLIIAIVLNARRDIFLKSVMAYCANPGLIITGGTLSLLGGLAVLIGHPIWTLDWRGLITILGLLTFIKGIVHLACPEFVFFLASNIIQNKHYYFIYLLIIALIGLYLSAKGFSTG
jgi:hypothetical protein